MNVALVQPRITPEWGGAWTFQQSVLRAIRELDDETSHRFHSYDVTDTTLSVARRTLTRGLRRLQDDILEVPRVVARRTSLEREMDRAGIDIVWFTTPFAVDVGRPYVFTLWDLAHMTQPWYPEVSSGGQWERRDSFYRRVIEPATAVIVANEAERDLLTHAYTIGPERILCLPHPTPDWALAASERTPASDASLGRFGIHQPYLLYPAQFWAHKDHPTLLDALVELPEYELVLVGSDKGQAELVKTRARELGVADRTHFLGFVATEDLVELYQHAHALTFSSLFGPENLPPLEACALGCPAIVADVRGAREQLGDAVLRVPPMDAEAVVHAVRELEQPEVRERQIQRGHERARRGTAEDYVRGVIGFLDRFELIRRSWA